MRDARLNLDIPRSESRSAFWILCEGYPRISVWDTGGLHISYGRPRYGTCDMGGRDISYKIPSYERPIRAHDMGVRYGRAIWAAEVVG